MVFMKGLGTLGLLRNKKKTNNEKHLSFPKIELALKILTFIALFVGGGWALYLYQAAGGDGWAINIKLEAKVLPYHDNLRLLVVNVKAINARKFEVELDPKIGDMYELRFSKLPSVMKENSVIDEAGGDLMQRVSLLPQDSTYDFMPGLEMDDMRTIVVPAKSTVLISAEIRKQTGEMDKRGNPDFDYVMSSNVVRIE
jgi:hypothetical protein